MPLDAARRARLRRASVAALLTFAAVLAAGSFLANAFERESTPSFGIGRSGFVERWNDAAEAMSAPDLVIGDVAWTDEDAGVFGHAFSPTLSVLGRVDGPLRDVVELAVVGTPGEDGAARVAAALELGIAVADPDLTPDERRRVLDDLALLGPGRPAAPDAGVDLEGVRYRSASDADRGRIGLGAAAIGG